MSRWRLVGLLGVGAAVPVLLATAGGAGGAGGATRMHVWRQAAPPQSVVGLSARGFAAGQVVAVRFDARRVGSDTAGKYIGSVIKDTPSCERVRLLHHPNRTHINKRARC